MIGLIGRPLSGKTTLARDLSRIFGWVYFSPGDLVRERRLDLDDIAKHGYSVAWNEVIIETVRKLPAKSIMDGYPRNMSQVSTLKDLKAAVVWLDVDIYTCLQRLARRPPRDDDEIVLARMAKFDEFLKQCKIVGWRFERATTHEQAFRICCGIVLLQEGNRTIS